MPMYLYTPPIDTDRRYSWDEIKAKTYPVYDQWGEWRFDPELLVLRYGGRYGYEIDLEAIKDDAEFVDWIIHTAMKTWEPMKLYYLIIAMVTILSPGRNDWKLSQDGAKHARAYAERLKAVESGSIAP